MVLITKYLNIFTGIKKKSFFHIIKRRTGISFVALVNQQRLVGLMNDSIVQWVDKNIRGRTFFDRTIFIGWQKNQ